MLLCCTTPILVLTSWSFAANRNCQMCQDRDWFSFSDTVPSMNGILFVSPVSRGTVASQAADANCYIFFFNGLINSLIQQW